MRSPVTPDPSGEAPRAGSLRRRSLLLAVAGVAVAVRAACFCVLLCSPLRFFHLVPGLDMQTLLRFSEWGKSCRPLFVVHRFLIWCVWIGNHQCHAPLAVILLQYLFGVAGALALTECIRKLSGSRPAALAAGCAYALYAPELLYESVVLQEAVTVNLTLISFWGLLCCRDFGSGLRAGVLTALAIVGRPAAVLLALWGMCFLGMRMRRKKNGRALAGAAAGFLLLCAGVWCFNAKLADYNGIFFNVLPYTLQYGEKAGSHGASAPPGGVSSASAGCRLARAGLRAAQKVPRLFLPYEVPENLNYHFLKKKFPVLTFLPGPGLLLPLTLAGMCWMLLAPRRKREFLLWMPLLLLALPLCAREAIGRYRLMLCPCFIGIAVLGLRHLKCLRQDRYFYALPGALFLLLPLCFPPPGERAADYLSWGIALEAQGAPAAQSERCFRAAWERSGFASEPAAVRLILSGFRSGHPEKAAAVALQGIQAGRVSPDLMGYYLGMALLSSGKSSGARAALQQIRRERLPLPLQGRCAILQGDAEYLTGHREAARLRYQEALALPLSESLRRQCAYKLRRASR